MFKRILQILIVAACLPSCNDPWQNLLDKELSQWEMYIGYKFDSTYNGEAPLNEHGEEIDPIGYNLNLDSAFSIINQNNENILRIKGEYYGCIYTKEEYSNYHLKLKIKWGDIKWPPRTNKPKDSGLLYHSNGEPGHDHWRAWMPSHEFQVMENSMGDYWGIVNTLMDIRANATGNKAGANASIDAPFIQIGGGSEYGGMCNAMPYTDKSNEGWLSLDLICFDGKSIHIVENQVVMILNNSRQKTDGRILPLTSGKIQLQSEAAEVFYKDIQIRSISKLPTHLKKFYK